MATTGVSMGGAGALGGTSRDDFLRLLVTQMRYQDPTSPMDNREFLSQLAQFASVEQTSKLATNMETFVTSQKKLDGERAILSACSLIGRLVSGKGADGAAFEGMVDEVVLRDGLWYLQVAGGLNPLAAITRVAQPQAEVPKP
jgi:flagellar basal-body rod modification protein FlgD